ncbi:orotidine-5'-phosphate decarboxylase [Steroidobacter denitrificans]|uniref:Orotidine-5'-phosphate decarboxylase n=1 Tax=Steroidobacter denitrificans TaxID=465721 RepID=A0A127F7R1_STEDE|nr:orotidine-5'-phosphate decarboxylase [Steroidobacter denitrificans]AMN45635.1 orotidine-5'-phosphate decarboxylase [Steroidobacter denitrificans]
MPAFSVRLQQKILEHSPLCVGIDPSAALLKGAGLPDSPQGAFEFGRRVLEAVDFGISLLKPQSAFFERFGSAGLRALEELVRLARGQGVLVLLDGKRGDIDSTAAAYAEGYFSAGTTLRVDAVTTQPYMGLGALDSFLDIAFKAEGGVFVVVRSSNPEGEALQTARLAGGESVAQALCREITSRNRQWSESIGADAGPLPGPVGAVVGATCADADAMTVAMPHSFILAPGVGAQGATMHDVLRRMPNARGRVLPNISRAVLANGGSKAEIAATLRELQAQARDLM